MVVELPNVVTRASFDLKTGMNDEDYFNFCARNRKLRIERNADGEIIIMPPTGFETGFRSGEIFGQLHRWAKIDGRGLALDSNTEYILTDKSALSPDASWVLKARLSKFTRGQMRKFLTLCPDFIIELTSPSDRLYQQKAKMQQWATNGAQLGWLIDADRRTVYIYRPGQEPEKRTDTAKIPGEGPVRGFVLQLTGIWHGL